MLELCASVKKCCGVLGVPSGFLAGSVWFLGVPWRSLRDVVGVREQVALKELERMCVLLPMQKKHEFYKCSHVRKIPEDMWKEMDPHGRGKKAAEKSQENYHPL